MNYTGTEGDDSDSCSLDVADRGRQSLRAVAKKLEVSEEMVRLITVRAVRRIEREHPELVGILKNRP